MEDVGEETCAEREVPRAVRLVLWVAATGENWPEQGNPAEQTVCAGVPRERGQTSSIRAG